MASILEIYIQLGFHPANTHWKVPDPATRAKYLHYKYQGCEDSWLKTLRSHTELLELLQLVRDFLEDAVTTSLKLKVQRTDIESTPIPEVSQITNNFLEQDGNASRYWGVKAEKKRSVHGPQYPRDKDLIHELLAEIISFVIRSPSNSRDRRAKRPPQVEIGDMPLSPDSVAACGSGQPTHFVDLESVEDSDEDVAVESLPETQCETSRSPLIFNSTDQLVIELRAWKQAHQSARIPGTAQFSRGGFCTKPVRTDEGLAEVIRFKIDDDCMGWVLNKADGTRIYVKIHTGGRGGSRFHGWLGGDFGFTIEPIATKCGPSIAIAAPISVASPQNDHSHRSSRDQNPSDGFGREPRSQAEGVERNEEFPVPTSKKRIHGELSDDPPGRSSKMPKTSHEDKGGDQPLIWPEWLQNRPDSNHRKGAENILKHSSKIHHSADQGCRRCLDHGIECFTAAGWRRCAYCTAYTVDCSKTTSIPISHSEPLTTSLQASQSNILDYQATSVTPAGLSSRSSSLTDPPQSLSTWTPPGPEISFNFFSSDPSLGAISKPARACSAFDAFFNAALSAWAITRSKDTPTVAAVRVSWAGARWPLMVPIKDPEAFRRMISSLNKATASADGDIEVEVTCIPQQ